MRSALFGLCLMLIAAPAWSTDWVAAGVGARFERETETGNLKVRKPVELLFGHRNEMWEYVAEANYFTEESGNPTLSIKRHYMSVLAALRYYAFQPDISSFYPYFTAGMGGFREVIETTFLNSNRSDSSRVEPFGSLGVGVWGRAHEHLRMGAEFRVLISQAFDPKTILDLGFRIGLDF